MRISVLIALFLLCGCIPMRIYEEVKVPIKCNIEPTAKPTYSNNLELDLQNILIYDELLEADLKACMGE
ncbi:hypothetical protein [uncultured Helicobacter sp.]|uniref:hypothetical protein n=1 Tax=uncultured Helicobacter sp. TaxID=175537 RepID=UPI002630D772|nr:hypothetical protein [uncultured Helicobacter sp.]